jgi:hypothetical protein
MTVVSNDPRWWPLIDFTIIYSYFYGSWGTISLTQSSMMVLNFAVASFAIVVYDWGEQDTSNSDRKNY